MSSLPRLLRAAPRWEKNPLTWVLVSHSSVLKSLILLSSFALLMSEATCYGSALSFVFSPISNFAVRYSFTLAENLGAPRRGLGSTYPSGSWHLNPALLLDVAVLHPELADFFTWSTVENFWAHSLLSLPVFLECGLQHLSEPRDQIKNRLPWKRCFKLLCRKTFRVSQSFSNGSAPVLLK